MNKLNDVRARSYKYSTRSYKYSSLTLTDPILTEHEPPFWETGETVLEQTVDEGQSPQEQPSELSPHE